MTGTSRTGRAAWLWCVLVVAAVAAGPGASWSAGTPAAGGPAAQTATAPPTLIRVTIAVPSVSDLFTDVYLARDLGIFARHGLDVILTRKDAVVAVLQRDFHSSPSEASQIYDLLKDTWNPTGIPPAEAVRTEIQLDTEVLQESHAGPNRPLRESDFTDLQFVQGGGG